jgi:hypothetical protein
VSSEIPFNVDFKAEIQPDVFQVIPIRVIIRLTAPIRMLVETSNFNT